MPKRSASKTAVMVAKNLDLAAIATAAIDAIDVQSA